MHQLGIQYPPPIPVPVNDGVLSPVLVNGWYDVSVLCAAEGGLKGAHAEEWVTLGALRAISMALEV